MKKFTQIDIKQKTYTDELKENIYQIINENVEHQPMINGIHKLIVKERLQERLKFLREFKSHIYANGLDMNKLHKHMDSLEEAYSQFEHGLEKYEDEIRQILGDDYDMGESDSTALIDFYYTKIMDNYANGVSAEKTVEEIKHK